MKKLKRFLRKRKLPRHPLFLNTVPVN
jgi:hypothetical protein